MISQKNVEVKHVCRFKTAEGVCGMEFDNPYKLQQHKGVTGHKKTKEKNKDK